MAFHGPFVTKTDAWLSLALKRIVKMAVDEGYDRVAFINGEQSAERYSFDKLMNSITAYKRKNGNFNLEGFDVEGRKVDIAGTSSQPRSMTTSERSWLRRSTQT